MRRMHGGHHMHPGHRTHPGTNSGSMHAGIVMRRMLEFVRDGIPGRHGQEDDDGTGDNPDDASKSETWHRHKTESMEGMLTNSPTERQRNF